MRVVKIFIHVLLLITTPTFLVFPHDIRQDATISSDIADQELNKNKMSFLMIKSLNYLKKLNQAILRKNVVWKNLKKQSNL